SGDMTISNGKNSKKSSLYPTAQPFTDNHEKLWVDSPENNKQNLSSLAIITLQDHVKEVEEMINPPLDGNLLSSKQSEIVLKPANLVLEPMKLVLEP
ncbi:hypothetical protein KI387_036099, partial [Taxus chinensis]